MRGQEGKGRGAGGEMDDIFCYYEEVHGGLLLSLMSDSMRAIRVKSISRRQGTASVSTGFAAPAADLGIAKENRRLIGGRCDGGGA